MSVNVEQKLGFDKYFVDEENAHIKLKELTPADAAEFAKLELACPANLYKKDEKGYSFDYAGCLECGTCFVLCGKSILAKWQYPRGSFGVEYRHG